MITRNAVFYKKTLFRAFLRLTTSDLDNMSMQEYMDYDIMLDEVLKFIHAPYLPHDQMPGFNFNHPLSMADINRLQTYSNDEL